MPTPGWIGAARGDRPLAWFARALVAYGSLSALGGLLREPVPQVAEFWPATGLAAALAVLARRRSRRNLAAVLLGVAVATLVASPAVGSGAALAGLLLAHLAPPAVFAASFGRRRVPAQAHRLEALRFVGAAAPAALVGGLIGGTTLAVNGDTAWLPHAVLWAAGDAAGILLVVPLLMSARDGAGVPRPLETVVNGAFNAASVAVAFGRGDPGPVAYLVVPGIVWSAVRLGPRWTWATVTAISVAVTLLGALGRGPFGARSPGDLEPVLLEHVFLCVVALMTGLLAAVWRRDAALAEAEHRRRDLQSTIDDALPGMMLLSLGAQARGRVRSANPAMAALLRTDRRRLAGSDWTGLIDPQDRDLAELIVDRLAADPPQPWRGELLHLRADGSRVQTLVAAAAVGGGNGQTATVQVLDISEQKAAEAQLRHVAQHDQLTGLANRALLSEHVERALRARSRSHSGVAVLFIDVDGFKGVNDSFGHATGDELLVLIAGRLRATIRPGDIASRIGGDEFAVVCTDLDRGDAERVAARVVQAMARCFTVDGQRVEVGVSVGIAYAHDASTPQALLREADSAMYAAKRNGRGCWETFRGPLRPGALGQVGIGTQLRAALAAGELVLHYQPMVNLGSTLPVAFEALLRWQHPQRGLLSPLAFLDVARDGDLMVEIDTWVVQHASRTAATWAAHGATAPPRLHVNIAARGLGRHGAADLVDRALHRSGLPPGQLLIEVPEAHMLGAGHSTLRGLEDLRALGVGIAVDDYGTGSSSLPQAVTMPVDCIKIDVSLVRDVDRDNRSRAVVAAVAGLSRDLGLECVAEGVETAGQCRALRQLGIGSAQGLLFSPARPAAEVPSLLGRPLLTSA